MAQTDASSPGATSSSIKILENEAKEYEEKGKQLMVAMISDEVAIKKKLSALNPSINLVVSSLVEKCDVLSDIIEYSYAPSSSKLLMEKNSKNSVQLQMT